LSPALDSGEDGVGGFGPDERLGLVVGFCDEAVDCGLKLDDRCVSWTPKMRQLAKVEPCP